MSIVIAPRSILVIRRDNIGDLLCTTPMLQALRRRFPEARITVLVNSYNAPALRGNVDIDEVLVYEKAKHRSAGTSFWRWLAGRLRVLGALRFGDFDLVFLATPAYSASSFKFARMTRARTIVGYGLSEREGRHVIIARGEGAEHEVEAVFRLLRPFGIDGAPPAMSLRADDGLAGRMAAGLPATDGRRVGLHISARKPQQRWPVERFAELGKALLAAGAGQILVFWAPGAEDDPLHPGDDRKAAALEGMLAGLPVSFLRTSHLDELIAGLSLCDEVVCADGGAMHIAAALRKPLVCLFGNSDAERWYPWGVPHRLLQKSSRDVADIAVGEVLAAENGLRAHLIQAEG